MQVVLEFLCMDPAILNPSNDDIQQDDRPLEVARWRVNRQEWTMVFQVATFHVQESHSDLLK